MYNCLFFVIICKGDFMLVPNLKEAKTRTSKESIVKANEYIINNELKELGKNKLYFLKTYGIDNIAISEDIKRAIKFGAEWMAEQFHFVTAHCCESANPASEGVEKPLHLITLICEDDGKNPYIVGGDNELLVVLRKVKKVISEGE